MCLSFLSHVYTYTFTCISGIFVIYLISIFKDFFKYDIYIIQIKIYIYVIQLISIYHF